MRYTALFSATALLALAACGNSDDTAQTANNDAFSQDTRTGMSETEQSDDAAATADDPMQADEGTSVTQAIDQDPDMLSGAVTSGQWFYKEEGPMALFGEPNTDALFGFRCEPEDRQMIVQRSGIEPEGDSETTLVLFTDEGSRQYYATPADGPMPMLEATIDIQDMFLDNLTLARRLTVVTDDSDRMLMTLGEPVTRVIEECRQKV